MDYFPIFLQLKRRHCLVVGGGLIAERKVRLLLRAGAAVNIAASELTAELASLRDQQAIVQHADGFDAAQVKGMTLVIAATSDQQFNQGVADIAEQAGVLCNVVDDAAASSFIVPAIVDRSPVIIAVGTGGNAPVLAQRLKAQIEAWLPTRIAALAKHAGRWRELVKKRYMTLRERRRFWQRFFDGPIAEHLLVNRQHQAERELRLELIENVLPHSRPVGEAYIVGAGPGDPGLVTLRAQQLIRHADVVLYDRLVSDEILDFARKDAELISVGKKAGAASISQDEINQLLIKHVKKGRRVCRLKGGDPLIFGRGGEEALALANARLPFQIVPGISAALGCAAYAGIPLTHRGISSSVTFATAKLDGELAVEWDKLAHPGQTLVLYMSVGSLANTVEKLIQHGLGAETPAAMVENGATDQQRVLHATLATIAEDAADARIDAPALLFVGETVKLGQQLNWFGSVAEPTEPADRLSWQREWPNVSRSA